MWILIQSLPPRAEKENERRTGRHPRRPRNGPRRARRQGKTMCQALAIPPTRKYQNEGGPGILDIVELLRTYSANSPEDVSTFLDAIAYNWLIAGTDAHGKNYALLIGAQARVRLAPLYDVASVLPYPDIDIERSEEHTSELQSRQYLVCRLLLEKKKKEPTKTHVHKEPTLP